MSKQKSVFYCQSCGYQAVKWLGKCPSCSSWNSFVEELVVKDNARPSWQNTDGKSSPQKINKPQPVAQIQTDAEQRIVFTDAELNRVLGGGLVMGSLVLLGGEPGIGKSTLMLQLALQQRGLKTLYVSGEESGQQIKMRAERIGIQNTECYILAETNTQNIFKQIEELQPNVVVIDSIQTLHTSFIESSPGSVSQIRECTAELLKFAKESGTPVILIGHITKDGAIAGPKVLEHMVDVVLQFEGDRNHLFRIVRAIKNRFGSTAEIGIYEMVTGGLREVANPSELLLSTRDEHLSGIAIAATMEGIRPMLIETQALVSTAVYGTPQRSTTGFDIRRLNMLLAVLEKRCGFRLAAKDVFLNITGGIRVDDPATDLAIVAAILSSGEDIAVPTKTCFAAEVGLSGEIRPVTRIEQRISEAEKLGFSQIVISKFNLKGLDTNKFGIKVFTAAKVEEVFTQLFG